MITPKDMVDFEKNNVIKMYQKLNQDLTKKIIMKIKKNGDLSSFTKAQMRVLARQGGKELFMDALKQVSSISRHQKEELVYLFNELEKQEYKGLNRQKQGDNKKLISRTSKQILDTAVNRTNKELKNLTGSIAFSTQKTYIDTIDNVYKEVVSGAFDYDSSIKKAVNSLSESGIKIKKDNRNYRLESLVKMNVMTSLTQTANEISEDVGKIIGANCVAIGHSPYCRPTHIPIDGVVMSLEEFKKYKYLTEEPNCYHIVNYDWRPEFEDKKIKIIYEQHLKNNEYKENYEKRQKQNYYARQVRSKKEEIVNLKGTYETGVSNEKKKELRIAQMKYRNFCKKNELEIDYSATWKSGYNK